MAVRAQIKLLLFLVVVGITAGILAVAFWLYKNILTEDSRIAAEIVAMKKDGRPPPDPGQHHFNIAVEMLRQKKLDAGRDGLYKLLRQFPRSPTTAEAKRIIGEMNLDNLYAHEAIGGKRDYIVQPGDSLLAIAGKHQTTLETLARVNGLTSYNLQPGDLLFVIPMNFDLVVDASSKTVTVMREGRFFHQYAAIDLQLPPNLKVPSSLEVASKSAINPADGRVANPVTVAFISAEKRIVLNRKGSTSTALMISSPTVVRAQTTPDNVPKAIPVEAEDDGDAAPRTGLFLSAEDLEEIYPLLRRGSTVTLVE
jgi:LysM repeat protein